MIDLKSATIDELINELKSRESVYYELGMLWDDPILEPNDGTIHIYDLRKEWKMYNKDD